MCDEMSAELIIIQNGLIINANRILKAEELPGKTIAILYLDMNGKEEFLYLNDTDRRLWAKISKYAI